MPIILAQAFEDTGSKEFLFYDSANLNPHGVLRNFNQFILDEDVENKKLSSIYEYMFNGIDFYADGKYSKVESLTEQDIGSFCLEGQIIRFEAKHTWDKSFRHYTQVIRTAAKQITSSQYLDFLQALNYRVEQGSKDSDKPFISNYLFSPYFKIYEGEDDSIELVLLDVIEHLSKINQFKDLEASIPKPNILFESIAQLINLEIKKMTFDSTLSREEIVEKIQEKIEDLFANQIDPNFESTVRKLYKNILGAKISDDDIDVLYNEIEYDFLEKVERYIRRSPDSTDSEYEIVFDNSIRMHYDSGQSLTRSMLPDVCFIVEGGVREDLGLTDSIPRRALKIVHDEDGNFGILVEDIVNDLPSDIYEGYKDSDGYIHKNIYVQNEDGNYLISELNLETMEIRNEGWQKILFVLDDSGRIKKEDAIRYFLAFSRNTGSRHISDIREVVTHVIPKEFFKEYAPGLSAEITPSEAGEKVIINIKSREEVTPKYLKKLGILESYLNQITALSKKEALAFPGSYVASFDEDLYQIFSEKKEDQNGKTIVYNNKHFKSVFQQLGFSGDFYKMSKKEFYSGILNGLKTSSSDFIQYVRESSKISTSLTVDVFTDDSKWFCKTDKALLMKLKRATTIMFGFAGIYMLKTGQLIINSEYKASNPIFDWEQMHTIYQNQMITDLSYKETGRTFYGERNFGKTLINEKREGYHGRFYNFLGAWTTGIKEGIPFKDGSGKPYIDFVEFVPNNDVLNNINEKNLKLDFSTLSVSQKQLIVNGILDHGLVKYISISQEDIAKLTVSQNKEIFFESSNYAAKELIKLIPKKEGLTREDIMKQIGIDMVTLKLTISSRKTVRSSLESAKRSWNDPNEVDKEKVTVYVKSDELGYWIPVDLLIEDADKFKVSTVMIAGKRLKYRGIDQKMIDSYIIGKIQNLHIKYTKEKPNLCFADWLIQEEQFYLFYKYIGDIQLGLSHEDFYSKPS